MDTLTSSRTTPACMFCQEETTVELTAAEAALWSAGTPIQDAMPERSAPERELIRSGIHPECWAGAFGVPD